MRWGYKLKIVKSRDAVVIKAKRIAKDFRAAFVIMTHKPLHAVGLALICVCEQFLSIMLPYLVVVAMAGGDDRAQRAADVCDNDDERVRIHERNGRCPRRAIPVRWKRRFRSC